MRVAGMGAEGRAVAGRAVLGAVGLWADGKEVGVRVAEGMLAGLEVEAAPLHPATGG